MNTLLGIDKYYYYFICILWLFLIFVTVKNRLLFSNLPAKLVVLNKGLAIGLFSVLLFYSCIPISFFYFDRFEFNPLGLKLSSVLGFSLYETKSKDFKYRIDTYTLSTRTGGNTRRQRVVVEIDQKCFYSHILAGQSGERYFVSFFPPKSQQENKCRRADDVESDIMILRASLGVILTLLGILIYRV